MSALKFRRRRSSPNLRDVNVDIKNFEVYKCKKEKHKQYVYIVKPSTIYGQSNKT